MFSRFIVLFLALFAVACVPTAVSAPGARVSGAQDLEAGYQLGVGDRVKITVYNEPALSGEFAISDAGDLSFPLIGDVKAIGRTTTELSRALEVQLGDGYLREPKVNAEIAVYRPFFILGEVKAPGQYPFSSGLTVFNAVATAQGFTPRAEQKVVHIRRFGEGQEETFELTPDLMIFPGDTVRIGERFF